MQKLGFFKTRSELDEYESMWHIKVYKPAWDEQATEVSLEAFYTAVLVDKLSTLIVKGIRNLWPCMHIYTQALYIGEVC